MDNEDKILEAIQTLTVAMENGFSGMNSRFAAIEDRLALLEERGQMAHRVQQEQGIDIENLKAIVRELAQNAPLKAMNDGVAIGKCDAYSKFEERGVSSRKAMRALRNSGTIRIDPEGKNTITIYLDGHCQRVIVVKNDKP